MPPCLTTEVNVQHLAKEIGEYIQLKDPAKARGFIRARVMVNTRNPLITGYWLPRYEEKDTWVEFRYECLQDFCYKCGRIGHAMNKCPFDQTKGGAVGYEDWTKAALVRDLIETPKPFNVGMSDRRQPGTAMRGTKMVTQQPSEFGRNAE